MRANIKSTLKRYFASDFHPVIVMDLQNANRILQIHANKYKIRLLLIWSLIHNLVLFDSHYRYNPVTHTNLL